MESSEGSLSVRALWIDDKPDTVQPVVAVLRKHGVDTDIVDDPVKGLRRALQPDLDVIFLDERMPGLSGSEVLVELRRQGLRIPVIMVTGYASVDGAVDSLKLGATDYLAKPCRAAKVLAVLREVLASTPSLDGGSDAPARPDERLAAIFEALDAVDGLRRPGLEPPRDAVAGSTSHLHAHLLHHLALRLADRRLGIGEYLAGAKAFATLAACIGEPDAAIVRRVRQLLAAREGLDERLSSFLGAPERWRDVNRAAIAAHLGIDPDRLDRRLYDDLGIGLAQLRQHLAIRQAIFLLAETDLQLKHVADDVGYRHPSAFTRDFHHCLAVPPIAFRRWLARRTSDEP